MFLAFNSHLSHLELKCCMTTRADKAWLGKIYFFGHKNDDCTEEKPAHGLNTAFSLSHLFYFSFSSLYLYVLSF